jgi:uncharacterized protein
MSRSLTPDSSLETLKKEARRWLKALREGDVRARQRLVEALSDPAAPAEPSLRNVQLALAREHGLPGWSALRQALDDLALAKRSTAERAEIVLRSAAWRGDRMGAGRVLARWPEIRRHSLHAAVVSGDLAEVERRLSANPASANRKGGPLEWEPLLYLAYARLPGSETHSVAVATALLDHGADPDVRWFDDGGNPFTALTGVIGRGESDELPHLCAKELAALLTAHGASAFDTQALYNTAVQDDDSSWLDFLWRESERQGVLDRWREIPAGRRIGGRIAMSALDFLLGLAVNRCHVRRATWLLDHGAHANGVHAYTGQHLHEVALVQGSRPIAELLVRFGAEARPLKDYAVFLAAVACLDREAAHAIASHNPQSLKHAQVMLHAAGTGRADVVALLLELGMEVDIADHTLRRGLHQAVMAGSLETVQLLVAHGADIDRPTLQYDGPLGWAAFFKRSEIVEFLAPLSRDVWSLTYLNKRARLCEILAEEPARVNARHPHAGGTPLFNLPDDEDAAVDLAALLLSHGVDTRVTNKKGLTAEQSARERGLIDAAELIRSGS